MAEDLESKVLDAHIKMSWDVTNFYARGIAFFLAINAAAFGYVLKAELDDSMNQWVLISGLIIGLLFLFCSIAYVYWVSGVWKTIQSSFFPEIQKNKPQYAISRNFKRGRVLFAIFALGALTVNLIVIIAYCMLLLA